MINRELIAPESIVIIGGSNNTQKPGGKIIRNLLEGKFPGKLYAVNPKETEVQGIPCFPDITSLPNTELAILAVPAAACPSIVEELASTRNTKAFIIISAGFGEETHEGFLLEQEILKTANKYEASLIGPNCIGLMNRHHRSVFTLPIPELDSRLHLFCILGILSSRWIGFLTPYVYFTKYMLPLQVNIVNYFIFF